MKVFQTKEFPLQLDASVMTIGSFDGIHEGHQALLKALKAYKDMFNFPSVCISFSPHPREVVGGQTIPKLTCHPEKIAKIEELGVDYYWEIPFDFEFASLSPQYFLQNLVIPKLNPQNIILGPNHRFGAGGSGTADTFHQLGYQPTVIPEVTNVSSTLIRSYMHKGQLYLANQALGYPYPIHGNVVKGHGVGRNLGFPTANVEPSCPDKLLPKDGVYSCRVYIPDSKVSYYGAMSVGTNPTISKQNQDKTVEVYILDFTGDLYGKELRLEVLNFLRFQEAYDNLEDLTKAIKEDVDKVKQLHM